MTELKSSHMHEVMQYLYNGVKIVRGTNKEVGKNQAGKKKKQKMVKASRRKNRGKK